MKKLILTLAIIVMAAPAIADVVIVATPDVDAGTVTISFTGEAVRGVALKVESDVAGAILGVASQNADFNCNMDHLFSDSNAVLGDGDALAAVGGAGVASLPATVVVVSTGVLDEGGNQAKAVAGDIIVLNVDNSVAVTLTITADTLRGPDSGVVGSVIPDVPGKILVRQISYLVC